MPHVSEYVGARDFFVCLFVCLFFLFFETGFLCSPGYPGTHSVDQAGLLRNPPASASPVLELQVCTTTPGSVPEILELKLKVGFTWVLGPEFKSSEGIASGLNCWAVFSLTTPLLIFDKLCWTKIYFNKAILKLKTSKGKHLPYPTSISTRTMLDTADKIR